MNSSAARRASLQPPSYDSSQAPEATADLLPAGEAHRSNDVRRRRSTLLPTYSMCFPDPGDDPPPRYQPSLGDNDRPTDCQPYPAGEYRNQQPPPNSAAAHLDVGLSSSRNRRMHFEYAVQHGSPDVRARARLGLGLMSKRKQEAIAAFRAVLDDRPSPGVELLAHMQLWRLGQGDAHAETVRRITTQVPSDTLDQDMSAMTSAFPAAAAGPLG